MESIEIIKKIKSSGIKQNKLAKELGITENSFSNKMTMKTSFTKAELFYLEQILK